VRRPRAAYWNGRIPLLRAADVSRVPLRERGTVTFKPPACRMLAGVQAQALPLRQQSGRDEPRCRIGRRPLVSSPGARPLHRRGRARVGAARSRCRGAAALLSEAKHQPRPSDPVLAHLRADDQEQAAPETQRAPRAEHGSNSQGLPRRADAISKAGVRWPDTGRVVRHVGARPDSPVWMIAVHGKESAAPGEGNGRVAARGGARPDGRSLGRHGQVGGGCSYAAERRRMRLTASFPRPSE
jgi:hypothetical protein